jgi:hypothetical protein
MKWVQGPLSLAGCRGSAPESCLCFCGGLADLGEVGRKIRMIGCDAQIGAEFGDDLADGEGSEGVVHCAVHGAGAAWGWGAAGLGLVGLGFIAGGREVVFAADQGGEGEGPADGAGDAGELGDRGEGWVCGGVEGVDEGHAVFGEAGDALAQGGGGWHGRECTGKLAGGKEIMGGADGFPTTRLYKVRDRRFDAGDLSPKFPPFRSRVRGCRQAHPGGVSRFG